jgi:hypothetical protein
VNEVVLESRSCACLDEREARTRGHAHEPSGLEQDAAAILLRYDRGAGDARRGRGAASRTLLTEVPQRGAAREITGVAARCRGSAREGRGRDRVFARVRPRAGRLRVEAQELARQAASQVLGRAL